MARVNGGMRVADWMLTLLLISIPVVGLIFVIVWACGVGNTTRVTFCRALLMWIAILIIIAIILKIGFLTGVSRTISSWLHI